MNDLDKMYKKICKEKFSQYGFKANQTCFWRVVDDVFQSFKLHKSVSGDKCTIEFGITPLCLGQTLNKTWCQSDHLKMFENDRSWFYFDRFNKESIEHCVNEMIHYMNRYLIPYFQKANTAENAYHAICEFQKEHYKKGVCYFYHNIFCAALKGGLYEKAIECLALRKAHIVDSYEVNMSYHQKDFEYIEKMKQEMALKIDEVDSLINMILDQNGEKIREYIRENEKDALKNLGLLKS